MVVTLHMYTQEYEIMRFNLNVSTTQRCCVTLHIHDISYLFLLVEFFFILKLCMRIVAFIIYSLFLVEFFKHFLMGFLKRNIGAPKVILNGEFHCVVYK